MLWFFRESWRFIGCARGTGRWAARRKWVRYVVPNYLRFRRAMMEV